MTSLLTRMFLFVFLPFSLWANTYYPAHFEENMHSGSLKDANLKNELFKIVSLYHLQTKGENDQILESCEKPECYKHKGLGYDKARQYLFGFIDLKKDNRGYYIREVYCHEEYTGKDLGPLRVPGVEKINCEHTWPQSKFSKAFPAYDQKSDLHHLFVTSSKANNTRSSYPFGNVSNRNQPAPGCSVSAIGGLRNSTLGFEPPLEHKGNVARALFYFSVRYKIDLDPMQEKVMREWHKDDPVNEEDIKRNDTIQSLQGNRNPFVDYPELVDLISDF